MKLKYPKLRPKGYQSRWRPRAIPVEQCSFYKTDAPGFRNTELSLDVSIPAQLLRAKRKPSIRAGPRNLHSVCLVAFPVSQLIAGASAVWRWLLRSLYMTLRRIGPHECNSKCASQVRERRSFVECWNKRIIERPTNHMDKSVSGSEALALKQRPGLWTLETRLWPIDTGGLYLYARKCNCNGPAVYRYWRASWVDARSTSRCESLAKRGPTIE